MQDNHDLTPTGTALRGPERAAVRDGKHWISPVTVLAANSVQVVAEMTILGKGLRIVSERAVLVADWEVEASSGREGGEFQG